MKKYSILIMVGLFCTGVLFAAPANLKDLVRKKYSPSASFTIDFDQSIYWSVREKTSKKSGTLTIAPGDRFRIELGNELYVSNGTVCWQYSKTNKQVTIRNLGDIDLSFHPSNLLSSFLERYSFSESDKGNGIAVLTSADSAAAAPYHGIVITVQRSSGTVNLLEFTDNNENRHTYRFRKTVFTAKQPLSLFEFEVPADADVIDHRQ